MNPRDKRHMARLCRKVDHDRDAAEPMRRARVERLEQIAGDAYNPKTIKEKSPIPLLQLAMGITTRHLVGRNPRVRTSTKVRDLRPEAAAFQEDVNTTICDIELAKTLRRLVSQGWVGPAFAKCGLDDQGEFFLDDIDFDDWVHDANAPAPGKWQYCGNAYRVPLDWAKGNKRFKSAVRDRLQPDEPRVKDEKGGRKASSLSAGNYASEENDLDPHVTLHDFWIPGDNIVVTVPWGENHQREEALGVEEWDGPEDGPYIPLTLGLYLPGSALPISPAVPLAQLGGVVNAIWRDIINGALSHKEWYGVPLGSEGDAENMSRTATRTFVKMDRPGDIQRIEFGIPNQALMALVMELQRLFSWMAGNLDVMGGLAPGSGTVGQDKLMSANASKVIEDYQGEVLEFVHTICAKYIGWYRWHSDKRRLHTLKIPGVSLEFTSEFGPDRRGHWPDYAIAVEPYSLTYRSPNEQLGVLSQVLQQHVYPNMAALQQQGSVFLPEKLMAHVSELANLPVLDELFLHTEPREVGQSGEPSRKPSYSQREYTRKSVPSGTEDTRRQGMMAAMLKAGQPAA